MPTSDATEARVERWARAIRECLDRFWIDCPVDGADGDVIDAVTRLSVFKGRRQQCRGFLDGLLARAAIALSDQEAAERVACPESDVNDHLLYLENVVEQAVHSAKVALDAMDAIRSIRRLLTPSASAVELVKVYGKTVHEATVHALSDSRDVSQFAASHAAENTAEAALLRHIALAEARGAVPRWRHPFLDPPPVCDCIDVWAYGQRVPDCYFDGNSFHTYADGERDSEEVSGVDAWMDSGPGPDLAALAAPRPVSSTQAEGGGKD